MILLKVVFQKNWLVEGPFQFYVAFLGSLKVFLQKDLEKLTRNSVGTEPTTNNHITDSTLTSTHRGIKLLSSSALVSDYIATPLGLYC